MFVVCGEALMDVFSVGDSPTGMTLDARVGGSPFNVAVGLARLAQPVAFLGAVSSGFLGERLMQVLRSEGVDTAIATRVDAPTTLGLVGLDAHGAADYAFYGHGGADRQLGADALARVPARISAVQVGSFAMVVEPTGATLRALVEREHARGTVICYDPNVRLNVEPDLGRWREVLRWMLPRTHVLKVSEEDLQTLQPGVQPAAWARDALDQGVRLVVVTHGAQGASAWTGGAQVDVAARPATVVDTVGAGDTFQAALLAWLADHGCLNAHALGLLNGAPLRDALDYAARSAAITCSRRGADMPRRTEMQGN